MHKRLKNSRIGLQLNNTIIPKYFHIDVFKNRHDNQNILCKYLMILFSTDNDLYEKLVNSTTNDDVKDDLEENILNLLISYDTVLGFKSIVLEKKRNY